MQADEKLVLRLEKLARLKLSVEERKKITADLNSMLRMVDKLQELDTDNVEPLVYLTDEVNVLREDEVKHQITRREVLKNAPDTDGVYFKVPKVM